MLKSVDWTRWTDWSPWNEPWVPSIVYAAAIGIVTIVAVTFVLTKTPVRVVRNALYAAPMLWVGAAVALLGATGALWSGNDWSRVAAVVAGTVLVLAHVVGPRVQSVKYRDVEILLAEANKAEIEGNEERSQELMALLLKLLSEQTPLASDPPTRSKRSKAHADATERIQATRQFSALEYEAWVREEILALLPNSATVLTAARGPYDYEVRYNDRLVLVDVRLGLRFPVQDYVRRVLGDYVVRPDADKPSAHLLVVNAQPAQKDLKRFEHEFAHVASSGLLIAIAAAPGPTADSDGDIADLKLALLTLLNVEAGG